MCEASEGCNPEQLNRAVGCDSIQVRLGKEYQVKVEDLSAETTMPAKELAAIAVRSAASKE